MLGFNAAPISYAQGGRELILKTSAWTMLTLCEPFRIRWGAFERAGQAQWLNLVVPRKQLLELVATAEDSRVMPIERTRAAAQHLQRYLDFLLGPDGVGDDAELIAHVGTTLLDLVALALGAERDAAELPRMRGLPAAQLQGIKAEIKTHFADPALSPGRVALKLGLSVRYLQHLLQRSGASFTERVLELRLQKARTMLTDHRHDDLKVGEIADACGFNEVPYFNRCFRRRFGTSPNSLRGGREV
jgi:AraC-like DNA-binding protein